MRKIELEKLKEQIQKDHAAAMTAIDDLLAKFDECMPAKTSKLAAVVVVRPKKSTSEIVEDLITNSAKEFQIYTILLEHEQRSGKKPTLKFSRIVSQVINKLRQRTPPEIEEVEKGKGSRSGTYLYKKPKK